MEKNSRIGLIYKKKKIFIRIKKCGIFGEAFGLMFRKKENAKALLFDFTGRGQYYLHSFFVFFDFLALWLDDKNKIVEKQIVKPFSFGIKPKKLFSRVIEIPINRNYKETIKKFAKSDGKRKV